MTSKNQKVNRRKQKKKVNSKVNRRNIFPGKKYTVP